MTGEGATWDYGGFFFCCLLWRADIYHRGRRG
jgi:hypothetical protein